MALLQDQGRVQPASLAHILPDRSRVRVGYRQSSPPCLDGRHFGHFRERTSVLGSGAANSRSRSLSHSFGVPGECATERKGRARDASGPENARSDSYHVAWSAIVGRWCQFYRGRGLNCYGGPGPLSRYTTTVTCSAVLLHDHSEEQSVSLESRKATTFVGRSLRCSVLVPARRVMPPRQVGWQQPGY